MLTQWTISNFKSIREPTVFDLAPLTIFAGANSSGKSTVIQSILMVAQSFMSSVRSEPIILNGQLIQLGSFADVLHHGYDEAPMEIGFEFLPGRQGDLAIRVGTRLVKRKALRSVAKRADRFYPHVQYTDVRFIRHQVKKGRKIFTLKVEAFPNADIGDYLHRLSPDLREQIKQGIYDYTLSEPEQVEIVRDTSLERVERVGIANIIPWRLLIGIDSELRQLIDDTEWIMDILEQKGDTGEMPVIGPYAPSLSPLISAVFKKMRLPSSRSDGWQRGHRLEERERGDLTPFHKKIIRSIEPPSRYDVVQFLREGDYYRGAVRDFNRRLASALSEYLRTRPDFSRRTNKADIEVRLFPAEYAEALDQIRQVMSSQIYYLGPLRDAPRVVYAVPSLSNQRTVGLKGEFTAAMLDEYRNMLVDFPLPPDQFTGTYRVKQGLLIEALVVWLQRMGLVESIDTEETPKVGYRLSVSSPGLNKSLDLTSVGVGVSQVLPTLVLALLAPNDSTLIFEQPELHLHPKVESILGDFFLGMAMLGKQCIIETHSEHLINRLRRRIVEAPGDKILKQVKIYFVEKENAVSKFREVSPNEYGAILEWPKGFFDEAEEEASIILKGQMEKRKRARRQSVQNTGEK